MTLYTVGHSTRAAQELLKPLYEAGVESLVDVRRYPSSRRHPQHNRGLLEQTLARAGIRYLWLGESLGGRRRQILPRESSPNGAWREEGFRNYADAMYTPEFQAGIVKLEALAGELPTVVLCAERDWSRCHRQLIADLLLARGWSVVHLDDPGRSTEHRLTASARVREGQVTYPSLL